MCRDPCSSCSQGAILPFLPLGHWPSPSKHRVGAWLLSITATSDGSWFWSCSHSFTFRPTGLLASQVAPTLTHYACWAAEAFTAAHITVGYLPRAAAMLTIQTGQLMVRGLAPLRPDSLVGYSVYRAARYPCVIPIMPAQSPAWATPRLPAMTESPFAPSRCYLVGSRIEHALDQRYPILIALTDSCVMPRSSVSLCHKL